MEPIGPTIGADKSLRDAAAQVLATFAVLEQRLTNICFHGRVVLSRMQHPDLRASIVIELERRLAKRQGELKRACSFMEETV